MPYLPKIRGQIAHVSVSQVVDLGNRKSGYIGDFQPLDSRQAGRLAETRQRRRRRIMTR